MSIDDLRRKLERGEHLSLAEHVRMAEVMRAVLGEFFDA